MNRSNALKAVIALAAAALVAGMVYAFGLTSKDPSCFAKGEFWGCVSNR